MASCSHPLTNNLLHAGTTQVEDSDELAEDDELEELEDELEEEEGDCPRVSGHLPLFNRWRAIFQKWRRNCVMKIKKRACIMSNIN